MIRTTPFLFPLLLSCGAPDTKIIELKPDIVVAPESITFGNIVKLYSLSLDVQVLNSGRGPLDINDMRLQVAGGYDDVFTLEGGDIEEINGGSSAAVSITFTPTEYLDYRAQLVIESDDEDQPTLTVPITGSGAIGSTPDITVSANSLDFGTIAEGETGTGYLTIYNVGDGPLEILEMDLAEATSFSLVTDPTGQQIAAGGEYTVIAEYSPADDSEGHSEDLIIRSTDPDEGEVTVVFLGGNGGGAYEYPIADIDCDALRGVTPPTTVNLDGRGSEDPEDVEGAHELSYAWELLGRPELSRTYIANPTEQTPELFIDVAGTYVVELVVTDFNGVASEPTTCDLNVVPKEDLYIALSWDTGDSDLDLHLVPADNSMWSCMDCFFCNPVPIWPLDWGIPIYALDNTMGYGPENINVDIPGEQTFYIRTHYYTDRGGGPSRATISIYINGTLIETITEELSRGQRWKAGYVTFDASGEGSFTEEGEVETYGSRACPDC
jgi:hypothetical protein